MVRLAFLMVLGILTFSGCTDLMEFQGTFDVGVHVIDPSSMTVERSVTGIAGARSLCPISNSYFLVATTEGVVNRYDMQTLELLGSSVVDFASPAGFFDMVHSPMEGTVYLIGSLGKIVELELPECQPLDAFSICESPVDLLMAGDGRPYMYVADTAAERVLEVRIETNGVSRICQMKSPPRCIAEDHRADTMFVVTLETADIISTVGSGIIHRRTLEDTTPFLTAADMPMDTVICAVIRSSVSDFVVTIPRYFPPPEPGRYYQIWTGDVAVEGDSHLICSGDDGVHAYVLSYLGNSVSRLSSYNYQSYSIDDQLDISGYPMDLDMSASGELLVLTTD